jgi:DNA modification methylase
MATRLGRRFLLVDNNPEAIRITRERLARESPDAVALPGD